MAKKIFIGILALAVVGLAIFAGLLYQARHSDGMAFLNEVRYEQGEHKGAEFCKKCHSETYEQWKNNSRHAVALSAGSVLDVMHRLKDHTILNYMLGGEDMCYACHGPKAANEGINCETCHGPALIEGNIMESHEKVFKPNMAALRKEDFCAKCHEIPGWVTPYGDWKQTALGEQGITCQKCHMKTEEGKRAYHGFDSFAINQSIYENDISLNNVHFDFPQLTMNIENHITAHGVPAGGPTRILSLEINYTDSQGNIIHEDGQTFAKFHRVMPILGFWPYEIIKDTQLKTAEKRALSFTLPKDLRDKIKTVQLILRFYEVADEYEGDIEKAYFISQPLLEKQLQLSGN